MVDAAQPQFWPVATVIETVPVVLAEPMLLVAGATLNVHAAPGVIVTWKSRVNCDSPTFARRYPDAAVGPRITSQYASPFWSVKTILFGPEHNAVGPFGSSGSAMRTPMFGMPLPMSRPACAMTLTPTARGSSDPAEPLRSPVGAINSTRGAGAKPPEIVLDA